MACAKKNPKHDKTEYGMNAKVIRLSDGLEPLIHKLLVVWLKLRLSTSLLAKYSLKFVFIFMQ
jgi:hypothetical protein